MASRQALIVATGTYEDPDLRRLRTPAQDAGALARVLADPAIGDFEVDQVVDQPHYVVTRAMERFFAGRSRDDLLLMHLSCHGVKDDDGRLYFTAANTERKWLASTAVAATYLNDLMERCRARSVVLLLDCCYSGAFVPGVKGDEGVHLKERLSGHGRAILTASNAIEYAWEGDALTGDGEASLFTAAIVEGLATGKADRDRDGTVSIDELHEHVYQSVRQARASQTPLKWTFGVEGNLVIAQNPRPPKVEPVTLPAEIGQAMEHPLASVRAAVVADLERLLISKNRGIGLTARQALEQLGERDDSLTVRSAALSVLDQHPIPDEIEEQTSEPKRTIAGPEAQPTEPEAAAQTQAEATAQPELGDEASSTRESHVPPRPREAPPGSAARPERLVPTTGISATGEPGAQPDGRGLPLQPEAEEPGPSGLLTSLSSRPRLAIGAGLVGVLLGLAAVGGESIALLVAIIGTVPAAAGLVLTRGWRQRVSQSVSNAGVAVGVMVAAASVTIALRGAQEDPEDLVPVLLAFGSLAVAGGLVAAASLVRSRALRMISSVAAAAIALVLLGLIAAGV